MVAFHCDVVYPEAVAPTTREGHRQQQLIASGYWAWIRRAREGTGYMQYICKCRVAWRRRRGRESSTILHSCAGTRTYVVISSCDTADRVLLRKRGRNHRPDMVIDQKSTPPFGEFSYWRKIPGLCSINVRLQRKLRPTSVEASNIGVP